MKKNKVLQQVLALAPIGLAVVVAANAIMTIAQQIHIRRADERVCCMLDALSEEIEGVADDVEALEDKVHEYILGNKDTEG